MDNLLILASSIDKTTWVIILVVLAIIGAIAVFKKIISLLITVIVIAAIVFFGSQYLEGIKEEYQLSINGDVISAVVEGEAIQIDISEIEKVELGSSDGTLIEVYITMKDGTKQTIKVPNEYQRIVEDLANGKTTELLGQ